MIRFILVRQAVDAGGNRSVFGARTFIERSPPFTGCLAVTYIYIASLVKVTFIIIVAVVVIVNRLVRIK